MTGREADVMLRATHKALRRLEAAQGLISRRNARRAIASAIRSLRADVDERFPSLARQRRRQRRQYASVQAKSKAMAAQGWLLVASVIVLQRLREAGAATKSYRDATYAREWAIRLATAGVSRDQLRRSIRSASYRDALLAEVALRRRSAAGEEI